MRFMVAGDILSVILGVVILGLGLLSLIAGIQVGDSPSIVVGVIMSIVGATRMFITIRRMRGRSTDSTMRFITYQLFYFLTLSVLCSGWGLLLLISAVMAGDSTSAGYAVIGGIAFMVGAVSTFLAARSMRRKSKNSAMRLLMILSVLLLIQGLALIGLGLFALVWALGTGDPNDTGYAILGGIVSMLGVNEILWHVGRLRMISQDKARQAQQAQATV